MKENSQIEIYKDIYDKSKREKKNCIIEWISFCLFWVLAVTMFFFHEPWYDEIQAWMIASDASIKDILLVLPHYEGHPPVWHLLLSIFAKNGISMEIGLRFFSLIFSSMAAWMIMFKSPFSKWVRILIPFTYFLFYQYTVINRPYSMLMLAFVLAAFFFKNRNKKPIPYVASLYLMCLCSAYGMLFAACLCLIWTVEILFELKGKGFLRRAGRDKRTWCLVAILFLSNAVYLIISPADNAYAQICVNEYSKLRCLIYMFLVAPADALVTDISLTGRLQQMDTIIKFDYSTVLCICISVALSATMIMFTWVYKKARYLVFPYLLFGLFGALVFFYNHHIGIIALFALFVLWCCLSDPPEKKRTSKFLNYISKSNQKLPQNICKFFFGLCLCVSLFWTVIACKNDIMYQSWYAKSLAKFAEEYHLEGYKVATQWIYSSISKEMTKTVNENTEQSVLNKTDIDTKRSKNPRDYFQYTKMCNYVDILAYSDENFIYNFNDGDKNNRYINHDMLSQEEALKYIEELGSKGYPEFIISDPNIISMMGLKEDEHSYFPVYHITCYKINKYNKIYLSSYVYARDDIFYSRDDWPEKNDK